MKTLHRYGYEIAYHQVKGKSPCVIFCGGFNSNMQGTKAMALQKHCLDHGQAYIRFDYFAHGQSAGDFAEGSISQWLADTLAVIDHAADDVVLVGSSMGGWLAMLAALQQPDRVKGLLLIACAADMTQYYPERVHRLKKEIDSQHRVFYSVPSAYDGQEPYRIYQHLIDDGEQHFLLNGPIPLDIPVHLIHGQKDDVVPWQRSETVLELLISKNATLHLVKHGDHRLSHASDLNLIKAILELLL